MKNPLVALAVLAVGGVASAQSSVTVFGVLDASVSSYSNKTESALGDSITTKRTALANSAYNTSRLGFRGTEDLGGGLAASFWLEAAVGNDDGKAGGNVANTGPAVTGFFNRRSTVSLSGAWGELRLGRDFVPTFWNDTFFDPFGANGVGANLLYSTSGFNTPNAAANGFVANPTQLRAGNTIGYFLPPNLGGVYGQVMYALDENTSGESKAGRYTGGRIGYASGPLDVALAYGVHTLASTTVAGDTRPLAIWNLGGTYDFGTFKLFGEYSGNKLKREGSPGADGWLIGATVPFGAGVVRASYASVKYDHTGHADAPKAGKWALGYVHNLSKRTALYATLARVDNRNGSDLSVGGPGYASATAQTGTLTPKTSTGYDLGIRHAF